MSSRSVVIIGSGLGGLECGYILARNGFDVTVLEQCARIGGCLQTFNRAGRQFDTGFHYIGGLGDGESLQWIFDYFNLMGLPWVQMDRDCVDEVRIGGLPYPIPSGYDNFKSILSGLFPSQKDNLTRYISQLKAVGDSIRSGFATGSSMELFRQSAHGFLCDTISDPLLRKVLSGAALRIHHDAATLPLYVFAQINNSFIQSGWRLNGGGDMIAEHLAGGIRSFGGRVLTGVRITSLEESEGKVMCAVADNGEKFFAEHFISNAHPAATLRLLEGSKSIRNIYRRRISTLRNSFGAFTVNICLKKDRIKYVNHNINLHSGDVDVWNDDYREPRSFLLNFYVPESGEYADRLDIITPMASDALAGLEGGAPMHRTEGYNSFKDALAQKCIDAAETALPGLRDAVERVFTSTSLTYRDYTSTEGGSAFGVMKDFNNTVTTVLSPRTPLENLLLTGQNLNLHGILGVSMTSLYTCAELLGVETIKKEFKI